MEKIKELEKAILYHKNLYYQGCPEISDLEYDNLEKELKKLDSENYVLKLVGSTNVSELKIEHKTKMLSLEKTYDKNELKKWIGSHQIISMHKIDGVSCSLLYEKGNLKLAKTRGNGSFGEDVTNKILWIQQIPKKINFDGDCEIRGELFCKEEDFIKLCDEMEIKKLEKPNSMRNIVAGLMSRKENIELCRYLSFFSFDFISDSKINDFKFEEEKLNFLKKINVPTIPYEKNLGLNNVDQILIDCELFMDEAEYQIDGIVFIYNDCSYQRELGDTAHHPRYKKAFKFAGEIGVSKIEKIEWSVSRNGILTPVAIITPIFLSGAEIRRVTLHNYGLVRAEQIKIGDEIEIIRSGEVIPKFLKILKPSDNEWSVPSLCPSCNNKLIIKEIRLICNNEFCPEKNKEIILNYIQKVGIEDISYQRIEEMLNKKLIKNIPDLYILKEEDFYKLDKVKEKLAKKLYASIQEKKKIKLKFFLAALGINGGAINKCEKIVNAGYDTLEKLKKMDQLDIEKIDSFAQKSANEFYLSLQNKWPLINALIDLGIEIENDTTKKILLGQKFCITGSLSEKRSVIEQRIRENGGSVVSSVSKNLNYLVTNEKSNSSKYLSAVKLGIKIITENELRKMFD